MEKCTRCQWHKPNLTPVYDALLEMAISGDYQNLLTDFELTLCGNQGCHEPTRIAMIRCQQ